MQTSLLKITQKHMEISSKVSSCFNGTKQRWVQIRACAFDRKFTQFRELTCVYLTRLMDRMYSLYSLRQINQTFKNLSYVSKSIEKMLALLMRSADRHSLNDCVCIIREVT